jgi:hypothetical protein
MALSCDRLDGRVRERRTREVEALIERIGLERGLRL